MNLGSDFLLGIFLLTIGVILWVSIRLVVREISPKEKFQTNSSLFNSLNSANANADAMIVVEPGGKLKTINDKALDLFGLGMNTSPTLESLAMKVSPVETFYKICAETGEKELSVNNQMVTAINYSIDMHSLILLKKNNHVVENQIDIEDAQFFKTIANFNQTISSSLDLEKTVHSILEIICQIIPADLIELNIWDDDGTYLIPYQIEMNSKENAGVHIREKQKIGDGYTGLIIKENQPSWLEDLENNPKNFVSSTIQKHNFHSFMGFPLVVGHEVLGTLEFFKGEKSGFSKSQFDAIENICLHISTSINNAILFREENQKAIELSSLAQLAQSVSYSKEPEKIFEKMLATIAPMIPVEIIGFLLFNNATNMLEAQNPFIGLPTPFIEIFKTEIKKDSNAEKLIFSQDVLLTENAQVDLHWIILGLDHIARAASIGETVLIPLISGGVSLGFIMASNHTKKTPTFSPAEMHLLMIVANQAAPIIENMILVMQSEQKALSADTLRRIAVYSSSNTSLEAILSYSIKELVQLFGADLGALLLVNKDSSQLEFNHNSIYGTVLKDRYFTDSLSTADHQYQFTITSSQKPVVIGEFDKTQPIIPFYQNYFDQMDLQSIIIVPLLVRDEGIGEIWIGSRKPYNFDAGDIQTLIPAAIQLASLIEQQHLSLQTDDSLRKTVEKLSSINKSTRELTSTLDLEELLKRTMNECKKISGASEVSFIVFDKIPVVNHPNEYLMTVGDTWTDNLSEVEIDLFNNSQNQLFMGERELNAFNFSPETKSLMIFSFLSKQETRGALYLFSKSDSTFSRDSFNQVQQFIANTSIAFDSALNYFIQKQNILALNQKIEIQQRIFSLNQFNSNLASINYFVNKLLDEINAYLPVNCLRIYSFQPQNRKFLKIASEGNCFFQHNEIIGEEVAWEQLEILKNPENLINGLYVLPISRMTKEPESDDSDSSVDSKIVLYPFISDSGETDGFAMLQIQHVDVLTKSTSEILEFLLAQIIPVLESRRHSDAIAENQLTQKSLTLGSVLSGEELSYKSKEEDPSDLMDKFESDELLRKMLNEKDIHTSLKHLTEKILAALSFDSAIIFQKNLFEEIRVHEQIGIEIDQILIESFLGQKNPIDFILKTGKILQVSDLYEQTEWSDSPLLLEINAQSFLGIPIQLSNNQKFIIYLFSEQCINEFPTGVIENLTKRIELISMILQKQQLKNIENEELIKNAQKMIFINSVNDLDQKQILEKLLQRLLDVIPAAQTGWIALWNEDDPKIKPVIAIGYKNPNALLEINFSTSNWSIPQIVFENKSPLFINDLNFASNYPLETKDLMLYQQATGSILPVGNFLIPIILDGNPDGILVLENFNSKARFETQDELEALSSVETIIPFFRNAIKYQETEKKAVLLTRKEDQSLILKKMNSSIFSATNINASIRNALNHLLIGFEAEIGIIYLKNVDMIIETDQSQGNNPQINSVVKKEKMKEICDWLVSNPNISIINETYSDEYWINKIGKDFPFGSLIFTPLIWSGEQLGSIIFAHREPFFFNDFHKEILDSILPQLNFVINNLDISQTLFDKSEKLIKLTLEKESLASQSKAMLDSFTDAIIITDSLGRINFCNRSVEKILGVNFLDFVNQPITEIPSHQISDFETWKNTILSWSSNPILLNADQSFSSKIRISSDRLLSLNSSPIIWNSEFLGTVSVFRDITLEAQVDRIKSEFIANVSHELRTPLTSIKGYADILLMGAAGDIPVEQKRFIDIIHNNASRLTTLVDNLLDISKIETDKVDLYNRAIYIDEIVSQVVKEFEALSISDNKETKFDIRIPKNIHPVRGDENRLGQIIRILLNNSYHYSSEPVNITIRVSQTMNETQIDIQDNGIGIKKEFQSHIFERFFRGEEELVLSTSGTGLGLAVAKSLVEMLGGQIWFFSSGLDGEGSVFSFTVPVFIEG